MLAEVLITGLLGAAVVALWFLAIDIFRGRIFYTPAALGSAIFLGARGDSQVQITAGTVLGYTLLHMLAFLVVATIAVRLFRAREEEPRVVLGAALLFVTMEVFVIGLIAILAGWLLDALSLWSVVLATLLGFSAMALFLMRHYPHLQQQLHTNLEERQ